MPLFSFRRFCSWQWVATASLTILFPGMAWADERGGVPGFLAGGGMFLAAAIAGLVVWLGGRRRRRQVESQAARTVQRMTALIEHTDCLLWEAHVRKEQSAWQWRFTLHTS